MSDINRQQLLQDLSSDDPKIRCRAAIELARRGDPACIDVLTQAMLDKDWDSCWLYDAEELLGQFRDERVVDALIKTLFDPAPSHLSVSAMEPLLKTGHPKGVDAVIEMMGHPSPVISGNAAGLIAELDPPIIDRLLSLLKDENPRRRGMAAYTLGQTEEVTAVESLIEVLADEDHFVRSRAAASLGWIGEKRAIAPLVAVLQDSHWEVRNNAAEALLRLGYSPRAEPLDVLLTNLQNTSSHVRIETLHPLKRIADPSTIPALVQAMKTDKHRAVRLYAAQALGEIGDERVIPDLLDSLNDADELVPQHVRTALEKLGHIFADNDQTELPPHD